MAVQVRIFNAILKQFFRIVCRIDNTQLAQVPQQGPLIIAVNHINFLDVPVLNTQLAPRVITAFVKAEYWEQPVMRWVFELWDGIPLQRGEADMSAVRLGLAALKEGKMLGIAPEGTRSGDGRLQQAHPGIVIMALRSQIPILPIVYWGGEDFGHNIRRLRRTDFHIAVGRPFQLKHDGRRINKQIRQQMADEIMIQIARLLPAKYHGYYADTIAAPTNYLEFTSSK